MKKANIQLETVSCPSCIKKIESTLAKVEGVTSSKVLFTSSKVKAEFDETLVNVDKLIEVITNLGYTVLSSKVV